VAAHDRTPENVLEQLLGDDDPSVRAHVGRRHELPDRFWERLVRDPVLDVRLQMAGWLYIPEKYLRVLLEDEDKKVRRAARNMAKIRGF